MAHDDDETPDSTVYLLDADFTDPARLRRERDKARELRASRWWKNLVGRGVCHYCNRQVPPGELTMDHVVPLARGGTSNRGNLVPACKACNASKKLGTPAEDLLKKL